MGNLNFGQRKLISIVGTRSGDPQGKKICRELVAGMREFDPIIVPGFARCIDIIAHDQALKSNLTTIAVWPTASIKFTLPNTRFFLIKLRRKEVLFLSSPLRKNLTVNIFWFATASLRVCRMPRWSFNPNPRAVLWSPPTLPTNTIGSFFSFPCEVGNPLHQGCHDLIRSQKAQLITVAEDLVKGMGWESESVSSGVQKIYSLNLMKRKSHFWES